jgi:VCBS repeat-containing protein
LDAGETLTDVMTVATADGTPHDVTITITGAEDAPVVTGVLSGSVAEDDAMSTGGALSITDVDTSDNPVGFGNQSGLLGDSGFGRFAVSAGGWTYALDNAHAAVQALDVGESLSDSYTFTASDGSIATATVTITGTEDASVISGTFGGEVTEGALPTASGTLNITDVDTADNPVNFPDAASTPGDNGYGRFELIGGVWTYTLDNAHPAVADLNEGDSLTDSHAFVASDGSVQKVTVSIDGTGFVGSVEPPSSPEPIDNFDIPPATVSDGDDETEDQDEAESSPWEAWQRTGAEDVAPTGLDGLGLAVNQNAPLSDDLLLSVMVARDSDGQAKVPEKPAEEARTFLQELKSFWQQEAEPLDELSLKERQDQAFWADLDRMLNDLDEDVKEVEKQQRLNAEVAAGIGVSLTAGFVSWALRAGSMVASFLAAMPAWRTFDPMPVLAADDEEDKRAANSEDAEGQDPKDAKDAREETEAEAKVDAMFDR